jgi:phytoene synthase
VKGETSAARPNGLSPLGALVRRHDRDRYQTALFAPAARREALLALAAFNWEIARVREIVTQPILGQIRLQWWREVIDAAYSGGPVRRHEVAAPLTAVIREFALARQPFERLIDARDTDLTDAAPPDMAALEDYAEATAAGLVRLALGVLGIADAAAYEAALDVGIAYGLAGLLRAMPFHAAVGRHYVPVAVSVDAGLDCADYAEQRATPAMRAVTAAIAAAARTHLVVARRHPVPPAARPALLPAIIADRFLKRLAHAGHNPFAPELRRPDTLQVWRLATAMLRRRF